jgi:hypothetical protein
LMADIGCDETVFGWTCTATTVAAGEEVFRFGMVIPQARLTNARTMIDKKNRRVFRENFNICITLSRGKLKPKLS